MTALETLVAELGIAISVAYVGYREDGEWKCDVWNVTLSFQDRKLVTDYKTGIGLRKRASGVRTERGGWTRGGEFAKTDKDAMERGWLTPDKERVTTADVVSSLAIDAVGAEQTFEDWCGDLGWDTDSRKALATYLACQEERKQLLKLLGGNMVVFEKVLSAEH
jgi:hypothetical protein